MKYLLDTNAWLRAVGRPDELNPAAQAILSKSGNTPFALSAISIWEVCTKFRKKPEQLSITLPINEWLKIALQPSFIQVLPVDAELAQLSNNLPPWNHEDPADRIIVATARREGLSLITSDGIIIDSGHVPTIDTR